MNRTGQFRVEGIRDIVLAHLAGAAAGGIEKAVVHREIDIGDERRHGTEALQERRQPILFRGFGRVGAVFSMWNVPPSRQLSLRDWSCRRRNHIPLSDHAPAAPPASSDDWHPRSMVCTLRPRAQIPEMKPVALRVEICGTDAIELLRDKARTGDYASAASCCSRSPPMSLSVQPLNGPRVLTRSSTGFSLLCLPYWGPRLVLPHNHIKCTRAYNPAIKDREQFIR